MYAIDQIVFKKKCVCYSSTFELKKILEYGYHQIKYQKLFFFF